jgi:hypothetical protein
MEAVLAVEVSMEVVLAEAVSTVGGSAEVGSAAEHSAVEDLAAMDMDAATTGADMDMDMGAATDTTVVTDISVVTAGMLAIPSTSTTSVATIRTTGLIPFAGDCRAFLLALSNRQHGAELGAHRNEKL